MIRRSILYRYIFLFLLLPPVISKGSFIEATMGTAVVNDATATVYNPAALTLLENNQLVLLGSEAESKNKFTGTIIQNPTDFSQVGTSYSHTNYFLPSGYVGIPLSDRIFLGEAVVANNFGRDVDQNSVLRYVMSDNNIQNIDLIPAIGIKLTQFLSIGAGINFSQADFLFTPLSGFPTINVPDTQSHNEATANAVGGDFGILLLPSKATQIGFNYRSAITYHFHGTSSLESNPPITSNQFLFDYWTPARYVLSINQFLSHALGVIGTVQWIQWDIFNTVNAQGIAAQVGPNPVILPNASVPFHFHNGGIYTLGSYYRFSPQWIFRTAASYMQSPGNPNYQITSGDSIVLGASLGYKVNKLLSIDSSYAHAFTQNQSINIQNQINTIEGINQSSRDSVSVKLTFNI